MTVIIGLVVVLFILIGWIIATHNGLVRASNKVKNAFAQIDTQLQRRFDLIPNLVEVVKGYAEHEKDLLESVTASRNGFMNANTGSEKMEANLQLSSTLKSLFAVVENYPELKANQNFAQLQDELSETEDKVSFARQFYNDAVTMYNTKIQMFPTNLIAGLFGFEEDELFSVDDKSREVPRVEF